MSYYEKSPTACAAVTLSIAHHIRSNNALCGTHANSWSRQGRRVRPIETSQSQRAP